MYELLLNRHTGSEFIRWMSRQGAYVKDYEGTPDRCDMKLVLTKTEMEVLRGFLHQFGHKLENAEGILKGLGN